MAKIMIAGLPSAGKSTYIGALAYTLKDSKTKTTYQLVENPEDVTNIKTLYDPWLSQKSIGRTTRGSINNIVLKICKEGNKVDISLPDLAGEDFEEMINGQNELINKLDKNVDGLIFLIKEFPSEVLAESFSDDINTAKQQPLPAFEVKKISKQVKNILLIKELNKQFKIRKIAIGISAWDCKNENCSPLEYLQKHFPVFYNYINTFYPMSFIFGLSAQGAEYKEENYDEMEDKTNKGTRAYIVKDTEKEYDLTIPMDYLIK